MENCYWEFFLIFSCFGDSVFFEGHSFHSLHWWRIANRKKLLVFRRKFSLMRKHLVVCLFVILVFFCKTTTTIIIIILDSLMNRLFSLFTSSVRKSTEKKNENKQQQLMKATSYCHTYSIHSFITILWFIKFLSFFFLVFVFGSCNSFIYSNNNNI